MFAAVRLINCKGRAPFRQKNTISSEKICLGDDTFFFVVYAKVYKGRIPYEKIRAYAGGYSHTLIFPESRLTDISELDEIRLLKSSVAFLSRSEGPTVGGLCIYDEKGLFCDYAVSLLPLASSIHVICPEKEKYTPVAEKLLREYGAVMSLSDSWSTAAQSCGNIITKSSDILPLGYKGRVFTLKRRALPFADFVIFQGIRLPEKYEELIPEGIDRRVFAEALYSRCGIKELTDCSFEHLDY